MSYAAIRFVSRWPSAVLREKASGRSKGLTQCLWGDWVGVRSLSPRNGWISVRTRGRDGFLREDDLMEERPLEVNFVDIGQGDGTFIVTPDDRMIVIDAGQSSNMYRFLKWRFNLKPGRKAPRIETAIITHPDSDHYKGFQKLFDDKRFEFGTLFHNGIIERAGRDTLGPSTIRGDQKYLTDIIRTEARLRNLLSNPEARGSKQYPKLLWTALSKGRVGTVKMLAAGDEAFPSRALFGKEFSLSAFAPVLESHGNKKELRWFSDKPGRTLGGNKGKTKNGHSVVTMMRYGEVRIMLGGDLNIPAEQFLLDHYGQETRTFEADIAKACHHGSADFSTNFLDRVNAMATVISSGDNESHSHPRADTLGTVGKHSRGERSLIFCTELARSAPERIIDARAIREKVMELADKMVEAEEAEKQAKARTRLKRELYDQIKRSVQVYGMITLRTDGDRVLLAQRLERPASKTRKWDLYRLERSGGKLRYVSKH